MELRGNNNGPIGSYHRWLTAYTQGMDWLSNLRTTKEAEGEASEEDEEIQALKTELKKSQSQRKVQVNSC